MVLALFILLVVLCGLDVLTTCIALKSKYAVEKNPILRPLMAKIGVLPTMIVGKAILLSLVYWLGMNLTCLIILNVIYVPVVINNLAVILQIHKATRRQNIL